MKKTKEMKKYKACAGYVLPVFYKGRIIHISDKSKLDVDESSLDYESLHIFKNAIKDKQIEEVK